MKIRLPKGGRFAASAMLFSALPSLLLGIEIVVDFEDFTVGAGNLADFSSDTLTGFELAGNFLRQDDGTSAHGILSGDDSPIDDGKAGYIGGASTQSAAQESDPFQLVVFSSSNEEINFLLAEPVRTVSVDFVLERNGGGEFFSFFLYDALDPSTEDAGSYAYFAFIGITANNGIVYRDCEVSYPDDFASSQWQVTGQSLVPGTVYRLVYEIDYANGLWSATVTDLDTSNMISLVTDRAIAANGEEITGWTTSGDTLDLRVNGSGSEVIDRLVFDNMTSTQIDAELDSDEDGLADWKETNDGEFDSFFQTGSDPNNPDSDGDLMPDGVEVGFGIDPNYDHSDLFAYVANHTREIEVSSPVVLLENGTLEFSIGLSSSDTLGNWDEVPLLPEQVTAEEGEILVELPWEMDDAKFFILTGSE